MNIYSPFEGVSSEELSMPAWLTQQNYEKGMMAGELQGPCNSVRWKSWHTIDKAQRMPYAGVCRVCY
jgi:hypothetical protein